MARAAYSTPRGFLHASLTLLHPLQDPAPEPPAPADFPLFQGSVRIARKQGLFCKLPQINLKTAAFELFLESPGEKLFLILRRFQQMLRHALLISLDEVFQLL